MLLRRTHQHDLEVLEDPVDLEYPEVLAVLVNLEDLVHPEDPEDLEYLANPVVPAGLGFLGFQFFLEDLGFQLYLEFLVYLL